MSRSTRVTLRTLLALTVAATLVPCALAAATSNKTTARPDRSAAAATDAAHDAAMADMMKYATPGKAHEGLKAMEGRWKATSKAWFGSGEPMVSEGTAENRLVLGGRYLEQRYSGVLMGQPFEGYGLTGYDNRKQSYTMLWVDNSSTEMMTGNGVLKDGDLVMTSSAIGPDGKAMAIRLVTRIVDANKHVFSMYGPVAGKEQLMMEITYTRM